MSQSPCIRNCCLDQQDCCLGCGRLLTEITEWHQASPLRQQQIIDVSTATPRYAAAARFYASLGRPFRIIRTSRSVVRRQ
ncbi:DUF1289 domain-containing protein [Alishewanella longhuensis]